MFKLVIIVTLNHKYNRQGFSIISSTSQYLKKNLSEYICNYHRGH